MKQPLWYYFFKNPKPNASYFVICDSSVKAVPF